MERVRSNINLPAAGLLIFFVGLGILSAFLIAQFGSKGAVIIPAALLFVFIFPRSLNQALSRFRAIRKQFAWWHWLWLLLFLSAFQFRMRDTQDIAESAVDGGALYRICLVAIAALVLGVRFLLKRTAVARALFQGFIGLVAVYVLFCIFSTIWSVYPAWTLYRSLEYLADVGMIAAIMTTLGSVENYKRALDWTWTLDGILLASFWLGALLWPADAFQPSNGLIHVQLEGVFPQVASNGVGHAAAILSLVSLSRLLRKQPCNRGTCFYAVLFIVSLGTMILAQTRSAIGGFLCGVVLLLYFSKRLGSIAFLLLAIILLVSWTAAGSIAEEYLRRGQDPELISSLSGRTDWWEFGWHEFVKSPLIGMGAYTARFTVLARMGFLETSSTHNTYLEILLGVGALGLIPVAIAILGTWRALIRELNHSLQNSVRSQLALEAIGVLAILSFRSLFTVGLVMHTDHDFLTVLAFAELLRQSWKNGLGRGRATSTREVVGEYK